MKLATLNRIFILVIPILAVDSNLFFNFREKRDDGSYLGNSGGPLAAGSKNKISSGNDGNKKESENSDLRCRYHDKESYPSRRRLKQVQSTNLQHEKTYYDPMFNIPNIPNQIQIPTNQLQLPSNDQFSQFTKLFGKNYDLKDAMERFNIFKKNSDIITSLNSQRSSPLQAVFGQTKYSDVEFGEFKQKLGGALINCDKQQKIKLTNRMKMLSRSCPQFDWNDVGVIPKVRDQKQCGSCYAMSSVDLIASQNQVEDKAWNRSVSLSPQYIVDCFKEPAAVGCTGGRPKKVLDKISSCSTCKIPLESCYPYDDAQNTCKSVSCPEASTENVKYSDLVDVTGPDEKEIMASMLNWGPVLAIVGLTQAWQFYNGTGIIVSNQCKEAGDHAVLVTGYNYRSELPYYIVKNSWGTDWGDKGYVRIEAGKNVCDIAKTVLIMCSKNCNSASNVQSLLEKSNNPKCVVRNVN